MTQPRVNKGRPPPHPYLGPKNIQARTAPPDYCSGGSSLESPVRGEAMRASPYSARPRMWLGASYTLFIIILSR